MRKPIELDTAAKREADEAYSWYAQQDMRAAQGFAASFDRAIETIAGRPQTCAAYLLGTRRCLLDGYPYLIVFLERPDRITIIAVAHGRRRPAYWAGRVKP